MPDIILDLPNALAPLKAAQPQVIRWCEGHWSELMFALKDRGLGNDIAPTPEALNEKFQRGESDPCWDACQRINMGAFEIFGAEKIIHENGGCPACAFANIIQHVTDLTAINHNKVS